MRSFNLVNDLNPIKTEIITHHFATPNFNKPVFTSQEVLVEWVVFGLGQCLIDCLGSPYDFLMEAFDGIMSSLDPRDHCVVHDIIEELQAKHEEHFFDPIFQSICFSGVNFYRFSYELYPQTGRITFFTDNDN